MPQYAPSATRQFVIQSRQCRNIKELMFGKFAGNPPKYQKILHCLPHRDSPERKRVPVRARIVWAKGGEQRVTGRALRIDVQDEAIFVEFLDPRYGFNGAWLKPDDVLWGGGPA